eukprot:491813-Prorocentrum_minimum.AAC.1
MNDRSRARDRHGRAHAPPQIDLDPPQIAPNRHNSGEDRTFLRSPFIWGWFPNGVLLTSTGLASADFFPLVLRLIMARTRVCDRLGRVARQASKLVSIPMSGKMESMNVAVAGGILMYVLRKQ